MEPTQYFGGCADGAAGNLTLVRYASLSGTYQGPADVSDGTPRSLTINVNQSKSSNGQASFPVTGTAQFVGFECFTQGSIRSSTASSVSGSTLDMLITTDDKGGGVLHFIGTFDPAATQFSTYSFAVIGGSCNGQAGSGSLKR